RECIFPRRGGLLRQTNPGSLFSARRGSQNDKDNAAASHQDRASPSEILTGADLRHRIRCAGVQKSPGRFPGLFYVPSADRVEKMRGAKSCARRNSARFALVRADGSYRAAGRKAAMKKLVVLVMLTVLSPLM